MYSVKKRDGSIVEFKLNNEDITAIVLDRGVTGTALDLLVENEEIALTTIGRRNISYRESTRR